MAKVLIGQDYGSYTFNAASKQVTLLLPNNEVVNLDAILLITNVTDNIIIYNFANPSLGGTLVGNTITLTYNTIAMSNTDRLQIWYYSSEDLEVKDMLVDEMRNLINVLGSNTATLNSAGELRVATNISNSSIGTVNVVSTVTTVSTVTSVTTLANQTSIGGLFANTQVPSIMQVPIELQNQKIIVT